MSTVAPSAVTVAFSLTVPLSVNGLETSATGATAGTSSTGVLLSTVNVNAAVDVPSAIRPTDTFKWYEPSARFGRCQTYAGPSRSGSPIDTSLTVRLGAPRARPTSTLTARWSTASRPSDIPSFTPSTWIAPVRCQKNHAPPTTATAAPATTSRLAVKNGRPSQLRRVGARRFDDAPRGRKPAVMPLSRIDRR